MCPHLEVRKIRRIRRIQQRRLRRRSPGYRKERSKSTNKGSVSRRTIWSAVSYAADSVEQDENRTSPVRTDSMSQHYTNII